MILVRLFHVCFQAEDGIRDLVRSRGLGDVYKRQLQLGYESRCAIPHAFDVMLGSQIGVGAFRALVELLSLIHI